MTTSGPRRFAVTLAGSLRTVNMTRTSASPGSVKSSAELRRSFSKLRDRLESNGMLWVAWPKKASGVSTDLTDNVVRQFGLECGLVDVKVCAIDGTWSGLKFVRRLKDR